MPIMMKRGNKVKKAQKTAEAIKDAGYYPEYTDYNTFFIRNAEGEDYHGGELQPGVGVGDRRWIGRRQRRINAEVLGQKYSDGFFNDNKPKPITSTYTPTTEREIAASEQAKIAREQKFYNNNSNVIGTPGLNYPVNAPTFAHKALLAPRGETASAETKLPAESKLPYGGNSTYIDPLGGKAATDPNITPIPQAKVKGKTPSASELIKEGLANISKEPPKTWGQNIGEGLINISPEETPIHEMGKYTPLYWMARGWGWYLNNLLGGTAKHIFTWPDQHYEMGWGDYLTSDKAEREEAKYKSGKLAPKKEGK